MTSVENKTPTKPKPEPAKTPDKKENEDKRSNERESNSEERNRNDNRQGRENRFQNRRGGHGGRNPNRNWGGRGGHQNRDSGGGGGQNNSNQNFNNPFPGDFTGEMNDGPKEQKKFTGRCRLFVGNITPDTTEEQFKEMFTPFGEVSEVFVNAARGFGFIRLVNLFSLFLVS